MQHVALNPVNGELRPDFETSPMPLDDVVSDDQSISLQQFHDFDHQYIMLDGGVFMRLSDSSALNDVGLQQSKPSLTMSSMSSPLDSPADSNHAPLPRLLVVPQHNMAVNSISRSFSVGGFSFLVSPTCVASESCESMLSVLDGDVNLSKGGSRSMLLWCSWFVDTCFTPIAVFSPLALKLKFNTCSNPHLRCMRCAHQVHDATSAVSLGRIARRCSSCRRSTVQVHFIVCRNVFINFYAQVHSFTFCIISIDFQLSFVFK
jgi:hypothetical protein